MRTLSWSMDVELDPPAAHEEHVQTCEECDRPGEPVRTRSHLMDVVMTAAAEELAAEELAS